MNIQRYGPVWTGDESCSIAGNATGEYVLYKDHMDVYNKAAMNAYMYLATKGQPKLAEEVAQIILEACR